MEDAMEIVGDTIPVVVGVVDGEEEIALVVEELGENATGGDMEEASMVKKEKCGCEEILPLVEE